MNLTGTSIYKRKDSPYWWIKFWCPLRHRNVGKSSGQRTDNPQGYRLALEESRSLSADARAARTVGTSARWETWVLDWLRMRHRNCARTLYCESKRWGWLDAFLTENKIYGPQSVTFQTGLDYMKWRTSQVKRVSKKHPSHNTALAELRFFSRVMRESVRRGFITASPLERMGIKKDPAPEKPDMSAADIAATRAGLMEWEGHLPLKDQWMTICFEIGIHQGCRLTETSVPLTDIDEDRGRITFHAKPKKVFTTQLHPALVPMIRDLRKAGVVRTCVLPQMASKIWHWFFKGRKERNWTGVCPHICFHCTRVTVITRMARAGVPIQQAMAYVGHADETIHRIYQRLQADDLTRCTAALAFFPSNVTQQNQDAERTTRAVAGA